MGSGMARRLLSTHFPLSVYNRNREKMRPFEEGGAFLANTPREAAARAEIVISMLADDAVSRGVWLGENGALGGAAPGTVLIESSTVTPGWIKELATAAAQKGCQLLDAPVTGSKSQAASGELRFLVGGDDRTLEIARPVLSVLGTGGDRLLVLDVDGRSFGLLVEEVSGVAEIDERRVGPPPEGQAGTLVTGVLHSDQDIALVIDPRVLARQVLD